MKKSSHSCRKAIILWRVMKMLRQCRCLLMPNEVIAMKAACLLTVMLSVACASAQQPKTYGFATSQAGAVTSADCSLVDNVEGCHLFNEMFSADAKFSASVTAFDTSLVCFVTDDPSQARMFFVFSLSPKSKSGSMLAIYKDGLLRNAFTFEFSPNQYGGVDLRPAGDQNLKGTLDEDTFSFHRGILEGNSIDWNGWYFDINMNTGRFRHGLARKVTTGRCLRHD
jgi:hypothetical protein